MAAGDQTRSIAPPRGRLALLGAIVLIHAAVLAAVAFDRMRSRQPARSAPALVVFDLPQPATAVARSAPKPIRMIVPPPIVETRTPPPIAISYPPMDAAESAVLVAAGCDLTGPVQSALRDDPKARAAVLGLPSDARSVANAVMLWNGRWIAASAHPSGQRALDLVRAVILATIASAPEECRAQDQAGPRLIGIPGPPDMTLALGSGHWRWGDLADEIGMPRQTANLSDLPTTEGRSGT